MSIIEQVEIAPGLTVSRIVTGLWQIADMERRGQPLNIETAAASMAPYFDQGITTFDMADHYGSAELIAGAFRQSLSTADQNTARFFTKWVPKPTAVTREEVRSAVETALRRLQMERLDLLQYHCWNYANPTWLDTLFWLQELRDEGLIAHLGVTNFDTAHLRQALTSGIDIVTNQVSHSLLDQRAAGEMSALCREFGIKLLAFGTLAGGFLTERWLGQPEPDWDRLQTWSQMKYGRYIRLKGGWAPFQTLLQTMHDVAHKHDVSMANVACKVILDNPVVASVIIGARLGESEHIQDNVRLFSFELDDEDRAALQTAASHLDPLPGDCGDEYRKPPLLTASGDLSDHLSQIPAPYQVKTVDSGRKQVLTGTKWESIAGYCRAVQDGREIFISGTTASHGERLIGGSDPAAQTHFVIDKIEGTLQSLGARLSDVVRTRVYITDPKHSEAIIRAHGARFGDIQPANTTILSGLIGSEFLVEIEAEARLNR